jgi:hypothetical protein
MEVRRCVTGLLGVIVRIALVVAALAAAPGSAAANVNYRVWFSDDVLDTFEWGDLSIDHTLLPPPAWACGIRIHDTIRMRQVDSLGATVNSFDFFLWDAIVWLPIPGCPEPFKIGGEMGYWLASSFQGTSYLEITRASGGLGARWIDANGEWPDCDGCANADDLTVLPQQADALDLQASEVVTLSASLLGATTQARVDAALSTLAGTISARRRLLADGIVRRRQVSLGVYEAAVRPLEDAALGTVAAAARHVESAASLARQRRFSDAFVAATVGGRHLASAQGLLRTIQDTLALRR